MRAFLAVVPPRATRDIVEKARDPLREAAPHVKWVHPSLWHLTLKFLGEVEDELVPAIAEVAGRVVADMEAFDIAFKDFRFFPSAERPRVLSAGITEGAGQLAALAEAIDLGLDAFGFQPGEEKFQAHMTLARFRGPQDCEELLELVGETEELARFSVTHAVLMRSVLRPRGPDYSVVEKLPLIYTEPEGESEGEGEGEGSGEAAVQATATDAAPTDGEVSEGSDQPEA